MRAAFVETLQELANRDPRIVLLTGDLGFMVLEPFAQSFPNRFFNIGVAEQNMVGVATGLADAGFVPYVYSIATFATMRAYEFIRNGPVQHRLPVRIVGIGGGFEYGPNGLSHYGLEDVALMRVQPGLTVVVPADNEQARTAFIATAEVPGPVYYRVSKDDKTVITGLNGRFELGRADLVREGHDLVFVSMGTVTSEVVEAARTLDASGVSSAVLVVSSFNPAPVSDLAETLARFRTAVAVEAHYLAGGLGSLVAETIADSGLNCRLVRCGVRQPPDGISGSQAYMQAKHGIDAAGLVRTALGAIEATQGAALDRVLEPSI